MWWLGDTELPLRSVQKPSKSSLKCGNRAHNELRPKPAMPPKGVIEQQEVVGQSEAGSQTRARHKQKGRSNMFYMTEMI
eukprot:6483507-Amphidinium_carterae.1